MGARTPPRVTKRLLANGLVAAGSDHQILPPANLIRHRRCVASRRQRTLPKQLPVEESKARICGSVAPAMKPASRSHNRPPDDRARRRTRMRAAKTLHRPKRRLPANHPDARSSAVSIPTAARCTANPKATAKTAESWRMECRAAERSCRRRCRRQPYREESAEPLQVDCSYSQRANAAPDRTSIRSRSCPQIFGKRQSPLNTRRRKDSLVTQFRNRRAAELAIRRRRPQASSAVRCCSASAGKATGNGCVGEATSQAHHSSPLAAPPPGKPALRYRDPAQEESRLFPVPPRQPACRCAE